MTEMKGIQNQFDIKKEGYFDQAPNLLPWRTIKKNNLKKTFFYLCLSSVALVIMVEVTLTTQITVLLKNQIKRNDRLKVELQNLNQYVSKLERINNEKMAYFRQLKRIIELYNQPIISLHVLEELSNIVPENVYLTKIEKSKNKLQLSGYAKSQHDIGLLLHEISKNKWFFNEKLLEIKKPSTEKIGTSLLKLKIQINNHYPHKNV